MLFGVRFRLDKVLKRTTRSISIAWKESSEIFVRAPFHPKSSSREFRGEQRAINLRLKSDVDSVNPTDAFFYFTRFLEFRGECGVFLCRYLRRLHRMAAHLFPSSCTLTTRTSDICNSSPKLTMKLVSSQSRRQTRQDIHKVPPFILRPTVCSFLHLSVSVCAVLT